MNRLISKANDLGQMKWAVNSADITETAGASNTSAVIKGITPNHGDYAICIETHKEYLYDEVNEKWYRPNA